MEEILKYAKENYVPIVRPMTLELLLKTIKESNIKRILEIGTAIGYSGIQMLTNSNAKLVTIEKFDKFYKVAENNFARLNLKDRVTQYFGDAKDIMEELINNGEKFDFVFLDGPKGQYLSYLPLFDKLLTNNGIIFADDVLFRGLVKSDIWPEHKIRSLVINLRKYLDVVSKPPYISQLIEIEDGVCITRKEKNND